MKSLLQHPIKRSIVLFTASYLLLILLGNVLGGRESYQKGLQNVSEKMLGSSWEKAYVIFKKESDPVQHTMDTKVQLINKAQNAAAANAGTSVPAVSIYYNSYHRGFLLTLFFIALAIAVPVPIKRKLIFGGIGVLLLQLFVLLRSFIAIESTFVQKPKLAVAEHADFINSVILTLDDLLVQNIVIAFVIPLVLWGLLLLRTGDVKLLLNKT